MKNCREMAAAWGVTDRTVNTELKPLPIGISDYVRAQSEYYYVDKTLLIKEFLDKKPLVSLFTRPRRFGKTLNMDMLRVFFEISDEDTGRYFKNKAIWQCGGEYRSQQGKYPVIFLSLKSVDGLTFEDAKYRMTELIGLEAERFGFLEDSEHLSENEKKRYKAIISLNNGMNTMNEKMLISSLQVLSQLLYKHFGKKVIILIDEYDVPLDKAFQNGFYREMVSLIRGLFGTALKTNDSLQFAVLTGCMRISKESIFTGLNNFEVLSILNDQYDESFGFTDAEVKKILNDYNLKDHYLEVKEWYDGYHFGNTDIYCPWDVIQYCKSFYLDAAAKPQDFWSNSSGNAIVRRFIDKADISTRNEIERLIAGESIEKDVVSELTYDEIDKSIENLWSVLFTTGYLTQRGQVGTDTFKLAIPNLEIRRLFIKQIREWFRETSQSDGETLNEFCNAFPRQNPKKIEELFGDYLWNTISIRDTAPAKKENFYHGILLGLLGYKSNWLIKSNAESGIGYSDILVEVPDNRTGIVIELKYAENGNMDTACEEALKQIEDRDYTARLRDDGMRNIIKYGIACYKKNCKVVLG